MINPKLLLPNEKINLFMNIEALTAYASINHRYGRPTKPSPISEARANFLLQQYEATLLDMEDVLDNSKIAQHLKILKKRKTKNKCRKIPAYQRLYEQGKKTLRKKNGL